MRDEDGAARLVYAGDVRGEVVAAFRERNDILARTVAANRQIAQNKSECVPVSESVSTSSPVIV